MRLSFRLVPLLAAALVVMGIGAPALAQSATASIVGTITSADDGQLLGGVCVRVEGESVDEVQTASDGSYAVSDLAAGEYVVGFNTCGDPDRPSSFEPRPGFAPTWYRDAADRDAAEPVVLSEGESRTVDAVLQQAAALRGTVTDDESGEALAGICVGAYNPQEFVQTTTAADGQWELATLLGGTYTVGFSDCTEPFHHVTELYDDVSRAAFLAGADPTQVTVEAGNARGDIDAGLALGGALRGTLTGLHHGEPIAGVCVGLVTEGASADQARDLTFSGLGPGGSFDVPPGEVVFSGVPAGSYEVVVNPPLCQAGGYLPVDADPVPVTKGSTTGGADLVLAPEPSIDQACFPGDRGNAAFSDVDEDSVHAPAINCLASYGIVAGPGDGTYRPAGVVRRDQMATFLARTLRVAWLAQGRELPADPPDAFSDDQGSTHELAINQLAALGVVAGAGNGRYAPAQPVSRAQMATFLVNAYQQATGYSLRAVRDAFPDDEGSVHEEPIDRAAVAGMVAGNGGLYSPTASVPRDQMATFVARLLDRAQRDLLASTYDEPAGAAAAQPNAASRLLSTFSASSGARAAASASPH